jgi:hypothetical protein
MNQNCNIICKCGHPKQVHEYGIKPACSMILYDNGRELVACKCLEYKHDNLIYLEVMAFRNGY